MLFECTKRHRCPVGLPDCCFCCTNRGCEERCDTICELVKDYSNRVDVPIETLEILELTDNELLSEYVSIVRHFSQKRLKHYKKELREEIVRRMGK